MAAKKDPIPTVEQLQERVADHLRDWLSTNAHVESRLRERVYAKLDGHADTIIVKLLGFNQSFNRWELDHCNGRSGNSAAGDYLRKKLGPAVDEWLDAQVGKLPKLNADAVKSVRDEYSSMFRRALSARLWELAKSRADEKAVAIMAEVEERMLAATKTKPLIVDEPEVTTALPSGGTK